MDLDSNIWFSYSSARDAHLRQVDAQGKVTIPCCRGGWHGRQHHGMMRAPDGMQRSTSAARPALTEAPDRRHWTRRSQDGQDERSRPQRHGASDPATSIWTAGFVGSDHGRRGRLDRNQRVSESDRSQPIGWLCTVSPATAWATARPKFPSIRWVTATSRPASPEFDVPPNRYISQGDRPR
jgi:hypothetical protein